MTEKIDYWDGESTFFIEDPKTGTVHILRESGCSVEIAERKWQEDRDLLEERRRATHPIIRAARDTMLRLYWIRLDARIYWIRLTARSTGSSRAACNKPKRGS